MKTNDLKKGDRVKLRNGWFGTIADNRKGLTRDITVEGAVTETGSCYTHDIVQYIGPNGPEAIEHTPAQDKLRTTVKTFGF